MIKAIITDIEGTTTAIRFVTDTLFPYATQHLPAFVKSHATDAQVACLLDDVRHSCQMPEASTDACINQLLIWIENDIKATPLKTLQGLIWKKGYQDGTLKGHLYQDAYERLVEWHESDIALFVYSSGSVAAQKLLFRHSTFGDLTPLFTDYFDTHIGHKRESTSYQAILDQIQIPPEETLFLSDITEELDAAKAVGMNTQGLARPEDAIPNRDAFNPTAFLGEHPTVQNFNDIKI